MKRFGWASVAAILALLLLIALRKHAGRDDTATEKTKSPSAPMSLPAPTARAPVPAVTRPAEPAPPAPLTAEEKAARIEKIKHDYDDIRAKASADYSAAGSAFPGGLNAFLRQLALLEREKRADLAGFLTPRELEDLELRETTAGQLVERLLGDTAATEEQRRAVFRLQWAYEDAFALTYDLSPRALLEREAARQQTQEQIHAVLGDPLFGSWLRGEGDDFARFSAIATRNNLPPGTALDLWRIKNEFTLKRLELVARGGPPDQLGPAQLNLTRQTEARVAALIGPAVLQSSRGDGLNWLPRK